MNLFKKALEQMESEGEFDKLLKSKAISRNEKRKIKEWYGLIKDNKDIDNIPIAVLVASCKSYSILQDIIVAMEVLGHDD